MVVEQARLREVFAEATAAAADQACVLFLDEIDTICPKREKGAAHENRVVAQVSFVVFFCSFTNHYFLVYSCSL
jgi:SpoVK/Ycf46/Vps4 family AAA+-type ATPase